MTFVHCKFNGSGLHSVVNSLPSLEAACSTGRHRERNWEGEGPIASLTIVRSFAFDYQLFSASLADNVSVVIDVPFCSTGLSPLRHCYASLLGAG